MSSSSACGMVLAYRGVKMALQIEDDKNILFDFVGPQYLLRINEILLDFVSGFVADDVGHFR